MGNGIPSTTASPASKELPPPTPRVSNIWEPQGTYMRQIYTKKYLRYTPKSGNPKPNSERRTWDRD